jgi:hypothetical protein
MRANAADGGCHRNGCVGGFCGTDVSRRGLQYAAHPRAAVAPDPEQAAAR